MEKNDIRKFLRGYFQKISEIFMLNYLVVSNILLYYSNI